jgi:outer membrane phospholipase A
MDPNQRLQLQQMITANNVEDNTNLIRQLKHSHVLRENVNNLIMLKAKYMNDLDSLHLEGMTECNFLFTYYTDLYNKIRKDEIDLKILFKAFDVLRDIEDGKIDQHDGAYTFGTLLKQVYVDSALKKSEKLNLESEKTEPEYKGPQVNITWSQFKKMKK